MADLSINMLPASDGLDDDSLLPVYQYNRAHKIRGQLIKQFARASVEEYVSAAQNAAAQAEQAAKDAQAAADSVAYVTEKAEEAAQAALAAQQAKEAAETARQAAEQAAALAAQQAVVEAENRLQGYVTDAENAKNDAQSAAGSAAENVVSALQEYLAEAEKARDDAQSAAQTAAGEATNLVETQLTQYVADAQAAKIAAEAARDEAQAIAGGDFVIVSDIVNDLVTNVSNKPLSAAQGVALKALIDAITVPTKTSQLTNDSGYLTSAPVASVNGKTGEVTLSASDVGAAPTSHASTATTYGAGTGSNYGHVKLSDNTNSTSGASNGVAATPAAVKSAYDLANTANTNANSKAPAYSYGTTDLTAGSSALETGKLHFVYE